MIILHFDLQPQFKYMNYFIYTSHHFTPHGRYELNKLASLPMCGFIAQLVEHRTGIAEVTGSNPVEIWINSGAPYSYRELKETHGSRNIQKTPPQSYKPQIKIQPYPGLV